MKVLSIILGILLTICGVVCLFNPGATFLATGYVFAIMLFVYGIGGIIAVIAKQIRPAFLWAAIPALIIGIVSLFLPSDASTIHVIMLYLLAFWFIIQGIISIYTSVRSRFFNHTWVLGLILGIIAIFLGIYTAVHPMVGVFALGILVGIFLIEAGINMIVMGSALGRFEDAVDNAKEFAAGAREAYNEYEAERNAAEAAVNSQPAEEAPSSEPAPAPAGAPDATVTADNSDAADNNVQ